MTPEKIVQNAIVDYLNKLKAEGQPVYVERRQAGGFSYKKGISDLYAVVNGHHVEIEVKRPGATLRPMQLKWKQQVEMFGGTFICADCVEDVSSIINNLLTSK